MKEHELKKLVNGNKAITLIQQMDMNLKAGMKIIKRFQMMLYGLMFMELAENQLPNFIKNNKEELI